MTDEEQFREACERYERKFGHPMGHDFAMPRDLKECTAIVERCISEGKAYDSYGLTGAPEDAVFRDPFPEWT